MAGGGVWSAIASIVALLALCANFAVGLGLFEPDDGKVILGFWINTAFGAVDPFGGDTPKLLDGRIDRNAGMFSIKQNIPANATSLANSQNDIMLMKYAHSDALVFFQILPDTLTSYTDADIQSVITQLKNWTAPLTAGGFGRRVLIRFAWEMNGNWFGYKLQPLDYITAWKHFVDTIRAAVGTASVAFVWAPNVANIAPYYKGATALTAASLGSSVTTANFNAMDTSGDGKVDFDDDPYTPWYPGDNYVDWVGLSLYGKNIPASNTPYGDGFFGDRMTHSVNVGMNPQYNFYQMFCVNRGKPLMLAEGGGAFYPDIDAGPGQLAMVRSYYNSFITNATFLSLYPKAKLFNYFEFEKYNDDSNGPVLRDYRLTNNTAVLSQFMSDLAAVETRYVWANTVLNGTATATLTTTTTKSKSGVAQVVVDARTWWMAAVCTMMAFVVTAGVVIV